MVMATQFQAISFKRGIGRGLLLGYLWENARVPSANAEARRILGELLVQSRTCVPVRYWR